MGDVLGISIFAAAAIWFIAGGLRMALGHTRAVPSRQCRPDSAVSRISVGIVFAIIAFGAIDRSFLGSRYDNNSLLSLIAATALLTFMIERHLASRKPK